MFNHLAPVGNSICLKKTVGLTDIAVLSGYQTQFYASGTAALAAAIIAAIASIKQSKDIACAEIILPAYGCPDLVSAVVFSGAKPILVDFEAERPWLDLSLAAASITSNTVAIVAVDLFGIPERWSQLRQIAEQNNLVLIEDSAQYFPHAEQQREWQGDLVVLSFGRGKPVSLLGGGAVLTKNELLYDLLPKVDVNSKSWFKKLLFTFKSRLYNTMVKPGLYWLPQSLPFLHLGETHYCPLEVIGAMDKVRLELLASNISHYQNDQKALERCENIAAGLSSASMVNNLPLSGDTEEKYRLLRYPLLVDEASRDKVFQALQQAGLGASKMYPASLPKIEGLKELVDGQQRFVNAEAFAARLITLPTHAYVSNKDIARMVSIIKEC